MRQLALIVISLLLGCNPAKEDKPKEPSQFADDESAEEAPETEPLGEETEGLEAVDGTAVIALEIPGFEALQLEKKRLAYYLNLAALELDSMYYSRLGEDQLLIKKLIEGVLSAGARVPAPIRRKIEPWAKKFWINRGNVSLKDGKKIVPRFIPGELAAAAQAAADVGIDLGANDLTGVKLDANSLERLEALLAAARPSLFDRSAAGAKTDGGTDGLNIKILKKGFKTVARHLTNSLPLLSPSEQTALKKLVEVFESDDAASLVGEHKFASEPQSKVRAIMGVDFGDGDWAEALESIEASILVRNEDTEKLIGRTVENASHFELQMPVDEQYKRPQSIAKASKLDAFDVLLAAGRGKNVFQSPGSPDACSTIAAKLGLANAYAPNVSKALNLATKAPLAKEFSMNAARAAKRLAWLDKGSEAFFILREIVGKPSGRSDAKLKGRPEKYLKEHYDFVENMRLDLVALFHVYDPKSVEIGLVPNEDCAEAVYDDYASSLLETSPMLRDADTKTTERLRAARAVVLFAIDKGAIKIEEKDSKFYCEVVDYKAMRAALAELLALVQTIKSTGDYQGARRLAAKLNAKFSDDWERDARARVTSLNLPGEIAFVYPLLEPALDTRGSVKSVEVKIPQNLTERQRELSKKINDFI